LDWTADGVNGGIVQKGRVGGRDAVDEGVFFDARVRPN
jgi:hypothetical protein